MLLYNLVYKYRSNFITYMYHKSLLGFLSLNLEVDEPVVRSALMCGNMSSAEIRNPIPLRTKADKIDRGTERV